MISNDADRIQTSSFTLDGEAVVVSDDGRPDVRALRTRRIGHAVVLYAFDLIEHDGDDLRKLPLIERKSRIFKLMGKSQRRAIRFVEHLTGDGPTIFYHVCRMGLEGIVTRHTAAGRRSRGSSRRTQGGAAGARGGVALWPDQRTELPTNVCTRRKRTCPRGEFDPGAELPPNPAAILRPQQIARYLF